MAVVVAALTSLAAPALAGRQVDERRPARADGVVEIESPAGSIKVIGWDRDEVAVTGVLGDEADGLDFTTSGRDTQIAVESTGDPTGVQSNLEIRVPAASSLSVETMAATIQIVGVRGPVTAENVNAGITVTDTAGPVEVETVNGAVSVTGSSRRVRAESVNGAVEVRGVSGHVEASTVNGKLVVAGGSFERASLETVNGTIRFEGALAPAAIMGVETVGGDVELLFAEGVSAQFSVYTFNGDVVNELGPAVVRHQGRRRGEHDHGEEKELSFTVGSGSAKVRIETLNGTVFLRKK
jgi:DUF4097 and DUF4098 domain-containing protein YvlB